MIDSARTTLARSGSDSEVKSIISMCNRLDDWRVELITLLHAIDVSLCLR